MSAAATTWEGAAPAKINLTLRVGPLRGDGFHPIESLIAQTEFADTVRVTIDDEANAEQPLKAETAPPAKTEASAGDGPARGAHPGVVCRCDDPTIPTDERNLAVRAALLLRARLGRHDRVLIELRKRIPPGAGLGGGSSNAAAVLRALAQLWRVPDAGRMLARPAAELGSDVPLFLQPGACIARGRGEQLELISAAPRAFVALVLPKFGCATGAVYHAFDRLPAPPERPRAEELLPLLDRPDALMPRLFNDLEGAAQAVEPRLRTLHLRLEALAGGAVRMTGSGSALFRLFAQQDAAERFAEDVRTKLETPALVTRLAHPDG